MKYRKLGNSDIQASVVAFGAWAIGGWLWGGADDGESEKALHAALDNGVNFIDTAPVYGFGRSEEVVGRAIKDRRDKVVLATKCGLRWDLRKGDVHFYSTDDGISIKPNDMPVHKYLHSSSIRMEIEESLKRLQTDYIDLYQTHWQDKTTPIEDTMGELLKLKDEGKIRAIGVSNATVEQLMAYGNIQTDQEKFNLLEQKLNNTGQIPFCKKNKISFLAYSPLAQGLLTGKIMPGQVFDNNDVRSMRPQFETDHVKKVNDMLSELEPLCEKYRVNSGQIIAAWTFSVPGVTHVLLGTRTEDQARLNAVAGSVDLDKEDIKLIDDTYRRFFPNDEK